MLTFKVPRKQGDELQDEYSKAAGLVCPPEEDMARQEDKQAADINYILDRFKVTGALPPNRRQGTYGVVVDYSLDVQQALHAVDEVKTAYYRLPQELRTAYPTWQLFLQGVEKGEITIRDEDPATPVDSTKPSTGGSAEGAGTT